MKETCDGIIGFRYEGRAAIEEMRTWSPERIKKFFGGLAMTLEAIRGEPADKSPTPPPGA